MDQKNYQILTLLLLLVVGCGKKETDPRVVPSGQGEKVMIVCEGSMGNGNASLSIYYPSKDSLYNQVYKTVNGVALGDVFQSITQHDKNWYCSVNNSDKVVVLDSAYHLRSTLMIPRPRYIAFSESGKAFVSSLFNNSVYEFDPTLSVIEKTIALPRENPEGMLLKDGRLLVCPWDTATNQVYVIDVAEGRTIDSFTVGGFAPQEIWLDKEEKIWVLSGNKEKRKPSFLTRLDGSTFQVLKTYSFPPDADPVRPVMNAARDTLYFIGVNNTGGVGYNGIYRMSISAASLPETPFIPAVAFQYFWALGIHPRTGDIYVGDPKGFIQRSTVMVYTPEGTLKKSFDVGVGVGRFYFTEE